MCNSKVEAGKIPSSLQPLVRITDCTFTVYVFLLNGLGYNPLILIYIILVNLPPHSAACAVAADPRDRLSKAALVF